MNCYKVVISFNQEKSFASGKYELYQEIHDERVRTLLKRCLKGVKQTLLETFIPEVTFLEVEIIHENLVFTILSEFEISSKLEHLSTPDLQDFVLIESTHETEEPGNDQALNRIRLSEHALVFGL